MGKLSAEMANIKYSEIPLDPLEEKMAQNRCITSICIMANNWALAHFFLIQLGNYVSETYDESGTALTTGEKNMKVSIYKKSTVH